MANRPYILVYKDPLPTYLLDPFGICAIVFDLKLVKFDKCVDGWISLFGWQEIFDAFRCESPLFGTQDWSIWIMAMIRDSRMR